MECCYYNKGYLAEPQNQAEQDKIVQYITAGTVQCSTVQCNTLKYSTANICTVQLRWTNVDILKFQKTWVWCFSAFCDTWHRNYDRNINVSFIKQKEYISCCLIFYVETMFVVYKTDICLNHSILVKISLIRILKSSCQSKTELNHDSEFNIDKVSCPLTL